jgi:hypothetical protein
MVELRDRHPTRMTRPVQCARRPSILAIEVANDLPLLSPRVARSGKGLLAAFAASICLWAVIGFTLQRLFSR